jgi:regulatory subunit for Cdc7p protein kinase
MSTARRMPLADNPNIANSPMRAAAAAGKLKRPYATLQREEQYGHPPPKKQIVDHGVHRAVSGKPAQAATSTQRTTTAKERAARLAQQQAQAHHVSAEMELEKWRQYHRSRFPSMVFYFESISPEIHAKLVHRITKLGAVSSSFGVAPHRGWVLCPADNTIYAQREEKFFSNAVTHIVTTRPIPQATDRTEPRQEREVNQSDQAANEPAGTINPSLLNRSTEDRRKMMFELGNRRQQLQPHQDDSSRRTKGTRNQDVLCKALDMGKKIWALDKFHKMLTTLLDGGQGSVSQGGATHAAGTRGVGKVAEETDLRQLLRREQLAGPSDRMGADFRELVPWRGPHFYVYDMDEKQKPLMIREYAKPINKEPGEWPQFRSVTNGRCPFVEEEPLAPVQPQEVERKTIKVHRAATATGSVLRPSRLCDSVSISASALVATTVTTAAATTTSTRNLDVPTPAVGEAVDMQSRQHSDIMRSHLLQPPKQSVARKIDFLRPSFTGRPGSMRRFAGEPAASGMQQSAVTSAIQSQMISSTSGLGGAKAGTSKEVHDLQRKVLQKAAPASQATSRQATETGMEGPSSRFSMLERSRSAGSAGFMGLKDAKAMTTAAASQARSQSVPRQRKRELKPGYCENCADKFQDFEEVSTNIPMVSSLPLALAHVYNLTLDP